MQARPLLLADNIEVEDEEETKEKEAEGISTLRLFAILQPKTAEVTRD